MSPPRPARSAAVVGTPHGAGSARLINRAVVALHSERAVMHAGLAAICARYSPWITVGTVGEGRAADVLLFDPSGRAERDASAVASLRELDHIGVLAVLVHPDTGAGRELIEPGDVAIGVDLGDKELVRALLEAARHRYRRLVARHSNAEWYGKAEGLTRRQSQSVSLCATGLSNQEIADEMFINIETVKSHLKRAYDIMGVRNRAELIASVLRHDT